MVHRAPPTLFLVVALATCATLAAERVVWKPVGRAVLKVDDRPARIWNVYYAEKKDHLLLVQLGRRFLLLDYRAKEIYELDPAKLERKQKELVWQEADKPAKPLATSDWSVRDTGPLRRVRATLSEEGRVLEVQVPTKPDLRTLY